MLQTSPGWEIHLFVEPEYPDPVPSRFDPVTAFILTSAHVDLQGVTAASSLITAVTVSLLLLMPRVREVWVKISARRRDVVTEGLRGFLKSFQAYSRIK
jgi:hypothetical protein